MNSKKNILQIKKDLIAHCDIKYKEGAKNFFKESINPIGVRASDTRRIAAKHFKEIQDLSKKEIFELCEELLGSGYMESSTIAFDWAFRIKEDCSRSDFVRFEQWLKKYVKNWAHCDDFCTHAVGALLFQFPDLLEKSKKWTKSTNRWMRRAAAVTLIYPVKCVARPDYKSGFNGANHVKKGNKKWLRDCFRIADKLLLDEDDLVQKGYGWMLKVAADIWQKEVLEYVMKNKKNMPRTALRYAIEKMPKDLKKRAMAK